MARNQRQWVVGESGREFGEELQGGETKRKAAEKELNQELIKAPDAITLCAIQRATLSPLYTPISLHSTRCYMPLSFTSWCTGYTTLFHTNRDSELSPFAAKVRTIIH